MEECGLVPCNDALLARFLDTRGDGDRDGAIEELFRIADPIIATVLARSRSASLRTDDAEDIAAGVRLRLLRRLDEIGQSEGESIARFREYVATLTFNAVHDHFRRRFPERARLKDRLRYVLGHDSRLAVWTVDARQIAGLRAWNGMVAAGNTPARGANALMRDARHPADALAAIFRAAGGPIALDELVALTAELWHVSDVAPAQEREVASAEDPPLARMELRQTLQVLWKQITILPARQRAALLLHLRDGEGGSGVAVFVFFGFATLEAIAAALDFTPERLAELWNQLPLDDLAIGTLLGVTRQQVINLRKAARERLAGRIQAFEKKKP